MHCCTLAVHGHTAPTQKKLKPLQKLFIPHFHTVWYLLIPSASLLISASLSRHG